MITLKSIDRSNIGTTEKMIEKEKEKLEQKLIRWNCLLLRAWCAAILIFMVYIFIQTGVEGKIKGVSIELVLFLIIGAIIGEAVKRVSKRL